MRVYVTKFVRNSVVNGSSCPSNLVVLACPSFQFKNEKILFLNSRNNSKESTLMRILEGDKKNFDDSRYEIIIIFST